MSKLNGKELSYGVLHGTIFIPNVGQLGPTLSSTAAAGNQAVKMTVDGEWVLLEAKDKNGKPVSIQVPVTNFSHAVAKEDKSVATNNKA